MYNPKIGIGYRAEVHGPIFDNLAEFDVFEVNLDHYLSANHIQKNLFVDLKNSREVVAHGVGLSIGTDGEPDAAYLDTIVSAIEQIGAPYYSEHLAFTSVPGLNLAELLPLPRTTEAAERVIKNLNSVQSKISVPFLLENIAYYFEYPDSTLSECEFYALIWEETGVQILLDVQNLYVNSVNHGCDPIEFIKKIPPGKVMAMHVAGGEWIDDMLVDDHGHLVAEPVFDLIELAVKLHEPKYIILERDNRLDRFDEILSDTHKIRVLITEIVESAAHV